MIKRGENKEFVLDCLSKVDRLSEDTWEDINDRHEVEWSSDHTRKISYGMKMYRDYMGINDTEEFIKLKKEKIKLQDIRTETNKQLRSLTRIENTLDLFKENIDNLCNIKPMVSNYYKPNETSYKDGILMLGDIHYGIEIDNSINQYNVEICKERLNKIIDSAIEKGKLHYIDKLHIVLLGDEISGEIHNTIKLSNQECITEQIVNVSELISECIHKLSNHFYCTISAVCGNHSRVEMNKNDNLSRNNYTTLIREFIKLRVNDLPNVLFIDDNTINEHEIAILKVKDKNVMCCHGDKVDKLKVDNQLKAITNINPDIVLMGHFHNPQYYSLYDTDVFINGSIMSSDEYSIGKKLYTPPSQTMIIVGDDVECSYIIKV